MKIEWQLAFWPTMNYNEGVVLRNLTAMLGLTYLHGLKYMFTIIGNMFSYLFPCVNFQNNCKDTESRFDRDPRIRDPMKFGGKKKEG